MFILFDVYWSTLSLIHNFLYQWGIYHRYYNFSIFLFLTNIEDPGRVLNLTIKKKGNDYKSAYVSWSPPALKDHNGVLKSYLFSNNHTGVCLSVK